MSKAPSILANEKNAAGSLDLKPAEFRSLVAEGVLPKPIKIGDHERWDVEQLRAIATGDLAGGAEVIKW